MENIDRSWTEIDLDNFKSNYNNLRKFLPENRSIMQIVKADAYGHGAFQIARKAVEAGARFLGVANADEGMQLRIRKIDLPILILSPSLDTELEQLIKYDLTPTISDIGFAERLNIKAQDLGIIKKVHININSGMGRCGIPIVNGLQVFKRLYYLNNLEIEGIFSHYSSSEDDIRYTEKQAEKFKEFILNLKYVPEFIHIANSSAVVNFNDDFTNLVRIGLLSYGIYTDNKVEDKIDLKPVMAFKSYIIQVHTAQINESIGYNRTFICSRKTRYAVLPVGYADGYDYLLSNRGKVLINNKMCDVIGKVSMDLITVDITDHPNVKKMDEVVLLGHDRKELRAENLTKLFNGSSYELLCQIGRRAKRYFKENGKIIASSPLLRRDFVSSDYSNIKLNRIIEAAIGERLHNKEMANLLYNDFLEKFIAERDLDIHYRKCFKHTVEFKDHPNPVMSDYYSVETTLKFSKILQNDYFYVACARNEEILERYFLRKDVEYRWLLDESIVLDKNFFNISEVKVNGIELNIESKVEKGCLELYCYHKKMKELVNRKVDFSISTRTYYPKKYNQLAVFISEMTQGVEINFKYGDLLQNVEAIPIFSGKNKFPLLQKNKGNFKISSPDDEWIFPVSGVVFVYK